MNRSISGKPRSQHMRKLILSLILGLVVICVVWGAMKLVEFLERPDLKLQDDLYGSNRRSHFTE